MSGDESGETSRSERVFAPDDLVCGRYRIARFLAQGGMGEVYEAEDLELKDRVALKAVRPSVARNPRVVERFKREVLLARKVTHPNVCRIFDIEHHSRDGEEPILLLSMEFLPGETLDERLRRIGRMSIVDASPLVRQLAEGLAAAHRVGVTHRDLKPGNVILVPGSDGLRPVITDFGLARVTLDVDADESMTQAGLIVGTASYMSPEQSEGKEITAQADIYALGVVMFEMVTGQLPHRADSTVSMLLKRLNEPPPSPREVVPDLDEAWDSAILRCLARQPEERYPSAIDVVHAIAPAHTSSLAPVSAAFPVKKRSESEQTLEMWNPRGLRTLLRRALGGALALSACVLAILLWQAWPLRGPQPKSAVGTQVTSSSGLDLFPAFSPDGSAIAYSSDRSGRFELYVKQLSPGGRELALTSDGRENFEPVWSPDGGRIAYSSKDRGGIWIIPSLGGVAKQLVDFGSRPAFSPDGSMLAFQSDPLVDLSPTSVPALPPSTIWLVSTSGGASRQLTTAGQPAGGHGSPAWLADGSRVAFVASDSRNSTLWSILETGKGLIPLVTDQPTCRDPVYSRDGRWLYYCASPNRENDGLLKVHVERSTGKPDGKSSGVTGLGLSRIRHISLSRDGRAMAYSALTLNSNLWSLRLSASGEALGNAKPLTFETGRNSRPLFSPDGSLVAYSRWRPGGSEDIWVIGADGRNAAQVTTDPAVESRPSWFPDGRRIAYFSNRGGKGSVRAISRETGKEELLFDGEGELDSPRLSPDGRFLAYSARREGALNVWLVEWGRSPARQLTTDRELIGWPSWSPDGRFLAAQVKRGAETQVALVPVDGSMPSVLTDARGQSWPHSWAPDGERIAFAGLRQGFWNIYSVSKSSRLETQLTQLLKLNAYVRYPAWSPKGDQIVFEYAETTGNIWKMNLEK